MSAIYLRGIFLKKDKNFPTTDYQKCCNSMRPLNFTIAKWMKKIDMELKGGK